MSEKKWNAAAGRWEIDGVPITYRVTWKVVDTGAVHTSEFKDVDQGYDFYQQMKRTAGAYGATWDHIPW